MLVSLCCLILSGLLSLNSLRSALHTNQGNSLLIRAVIGYEAEQETRFLIGSVSAASPDGLLAHTVELDAGKALHLQPWRVAAYRLLARALFLQGRIQDARNALEGAYRLNTTDPMVNATLGWFAWTDGDQAEATAHFRQAPGIEVALARQAAEWTDVPATQERALVLFETAIALTPREAEVYYDYADLLVVSGQREEAEALYERGRVYESMPVRFYQRRAGLWLRLGQPEMAISDYQQAIQLAPDSPGLYYTLGDILRDQGRLSEALEAYERGREKDRDTARFHIGKGSIYVCMGRTADAIAEIQEAIRVEPTNYHPYFELGQVLRLYADDKESALVAYQKAFQLAPHEMWPCIGIGEVYRAQAQYDQAAGWFSRARTAAPRQSEPLYFLGLNALSGRDSAQAVAYLEQAIAIRNDQAAYYRYLGEAYAGLGQWEVAIEVYERLLVLDPNAAYARQRLVEWEAKRGLQE